MSKNYLPLFIYFIREKLGSHNLSILKFLHFFSFFVFSALSFMF